jgi:hypothetical protein
MEEPTTKASGKASPEASPKLPPAAGTGKGQAKRAVPKPNQAKKTSTATTTGRQNAAIRTRAEHPKPTQAKPASPAHAKPHERDQADPLGQANAAPQVPGPKPSQRDAADRASARTARQPINTAPIDLVQMEIDLPVSARRRPPTAPAVAQPAGAGPTPPRRRASQGSAAAPTTASPRPSPSKPAQAEPAAEETRQSEPARAQQSAGEPAAAEYAPGQGPTGTEHGTRGAPLILLWAHLLADPGFAPEHVARAAIRELGPQASAWVDSTRERYPYATSDAVAQLAAGEFTRDARRMGAATSAGGLAGVLATAAVVARAQARLVLTIAAAYGVDPTAEDRALELLTLLRVPRLTEPTKTALWNLARVVAGVTVCRVAAQVMPFGAALAGAVQSNRATAGVAFRAIERYGRLTTPERYR